MANNGWSIWDILGFAYGVYRDQNPRDPKQTPIQLTPEQRALLDRYMGSLDRYMGTASGVGDYMTNVINQAGQSANYQPTYRSEYMSGERLPVSPIANMTLFPGMGDGERPFNVPTGPPSTQPQMGGGGGGRPGPRNRDMDVSNVEGGVWGDMGGGGGWSSDYYRVQGNTGNVNMNGPTYAFGDGGTITNTQTGNYVPGYGPQPSGGTSDPGWGSFMGEGGRVDPTQNPVSVSPNGQIVFDSSFDWGNIFAGAPEQLLQTVAASGPQQQGVFTRIGEAYTNFVENNPEWAKRLGLDDPATLLMGIAPMAGINPLLVLGVMGGWKLWQASRKGYFGNQPGRG